MIDEATIKRVAEEHLGVFNCDTTLRPVGIEEIVEFARAIEQLARQEQREEDARLCESNEYATGTMNSEGETRYILPSDAYKDGTGMHHAGMTYAEAIRASGKEKGNA